MTVIQQGNYNLAAIQSPGVIIQIIPPNNITFNGVPTNILGVVGIASWGPKNSPVTVSNPQDCALKFGPPLVLKHDLVTAVNAAFLQGANNFRLVRVTDNTDVAAAKPILDTAGTPATGFTATAIYSGEVGNTIQVIVANGSKASTFKVTVARPGYAPEVFDNIAGSGAALWTNIVNAINNGISGLRGPSELIVATVAASSAAPALATYTLVGGTNGNATINSGVLIGDDATKKGMYALRDVGCKTAFLADADDSTKLSLQAAFGESEGIYMFMTGTPGQSIDSAITAKTGAGIDSYDSKFLVGDWLYFYDTYNQQTRLISPQAFAAGRRANLSPEQTLLNKKLAGIEGTQKSKANQNYSSAEIIKASQAGIDLIAMNGSLGNYFACQTGQNTSSNSAINGDEYTALTNYIAYSIDKILLPFIGQLHNEDVRARAKATLESGLQNLVQLGMIGDVNGGDPYTVTLNASNNPEPSIDRGFMIGDVRVAYYKIIRNMLINYQGGQTQTRPDNI